MGRPLLSAATILVHVYHRNRVGRHLLHFSGASSQSQRLVPSMVHFHLSELRYDSNAHNITINDLLHTNITYSHAEC